jgi:general stress protein 26
MASLDDIKAEASRLSPWAHLATVGADGKPDVAPVHPAWEGDTLWVMSFGDSVKVKNLAAHDDVALHWQVTEAGDGVEVWGTARVHDDLETKRRLWQGVFDYDLDLFSPGGPEGSPNTVFISVQPQRAVALKFYGVAGRDTWKA